MVATAVRRRRGLANNKQQSILVSER